MTVEPSQAEQAVSALPALRRKVALACRILAAEDVSRISFGHVSARTEPGGDVVAMRGRPASDRGLEFCTEDDVVELDYQGRVIGSSTVSAPREKWAHLGIYSRRSDVNSVVHVHPRWVVALSAAGRDLGPIYGAYDPDGCRLGACDLATFRSAALIDSPELGSVLATALGEKSACVLSGHGIVTVGESVEAAVSTAIAVTELAHVTWLAAVAATGPLVTISADDQAAVLQDQVKAEQDSSQASRGVKPTSAAWQHFAERDRRRFRDAGDREDCS